MAPCGLSTARSYRHPVLPGDGLEFYFFQIPLFNMQLHTSRFKLAFKAMVVHFGLSLLVAAIVALLVFTLWFPYPYRELAGGRELFFLVMAVDIVCGPLLTFVLFSPTKPRKEMLTDISLIVLIQLLALCYGIWNVWLVRPLYVVQEADRLTIITRTSLDTRKLAALPADLQAPWFGGPVKVSLRPLTPSEEQQVIADIKAGGNDSAERPDFYIPFDGSKAYQNGHPLSNLSITHPNKKSEVDKVIAAASKYEAKQLRYVYIVGRHYWLAVLNPDGDIIGFIDPQ